MPDPRPDLPGGGPGQDIGGQGLVCAGVLFRPRPGVDADHRGAFQQRPVEGQLGDFAAGESNDQDAAVPGDAAHGLVEGVAADRIEDDVGAVPAGQLEDAIADAFAAVVDHRRGAVFPGQSRLLVGADAGDDPRAPQLAQLDGGQPDPAGGAVDDQGLAVLQVSAAAQGIGGGDVIMQRRRAGLEGHAVGQRDRPPMLGHHLLGEGAGQVEGRHPVAG